MQSMQLTKEQLQDKIFELEMELKEQQSMLSKLNSCDFIDGIDETCYKLELEIQQTICYIQYYQAELQYLEDEKYE